MKKKTRPMAFIFLLCLIVFDASYVRSTSTPSKELLGVAPEDAKYYKLLLSAGTIKCKDGSGKFTKSQLNDDFCDCPDGTDEPGTSACPTGKFYCRNAGHVPVSLYSSRVNDGICDCCDGTDEYDGKINCQNTCWEAGKVTRDRLKEKIATYKEGVTIRKREIEQGKQAAAKDEANLSRLKDEEKILKGLVQQLKERKEQIEKSEEKERLQKEKEERENKEAEQSNVVEHDTDGQGDVAKEEPGRSTIDKELREDGLTSQDTVHSADVLQRDDSGNDGSSQDGVEEHAVEKEEVSTVANEGVHEDEIKGEAGYEDTESLSREELGRIVGSRWTREKAEPQHGEDDAVKNDDPENYDETTEDAHDEEYEGYDSDIEDDHQRYNDEDATDPSEELGKEDHDGASSSYKYESDSELDLSDITNTSGPSWLEKIQRTVRSLLQAVNLFQSSVDQSEAAQVRKEYDESSAKLSKLQSRISSLTQKVKHDFGPEKEFYSFYGQCFESKQNKYVYKVCPFKQATQEEGYSNTRLGNWEKFEDSYRIMHFSNGDRCWNGPDRSLKVRLRCGLKVEVSDVDEPSRCEYVAFLSTPVLCLEEKLTELQEKLDLLNKEQPHGHDEL